MKLLILVAVLGACATDASPVPTSTARGAAYVCYTHASCSVYDAKARDVAVRVCLAPTKADALVPGDAAASAWASEWRGSCAALEGTIGGPQEGYSCSTPDALNPSIADPAPYGCAADCEPLFEGC